MSRIILATVFGALLASLISTLVIRALAQDRVPIRNETISRASSTAGEVSIVWIYNHQSRMIVFCQADRKSDRPAFCGPTEVLFQVRS
jgi:hypothetical protein